MHQFPVSVVVLLFAAVYAEGTTIVIQPGIDDGKDISLYERTDVELSSSKSLYAMNTGPPGPGLDDFTSLLEFDLSGVPSGAVLSATLWLYENNVPTFSFQHVSPAFPNEILVQPAASPWLEESVFYSTRPAPVSGYDATQTVDSVDTWFSWDVTPVVTDWLGSSLANYGFMVTSVNEVRNQGLVVGSAFDSSEQLNSPYLEINLMNVQPGDYNGDGYVNTLDYERWRSEYGSNSIASDGNENGKVDAADYVVWRKNASSLATTAGTRHPIPEPAEWLLVATGFIAATLRRHTLRRAWRLGSAAIAVAISSFASQAIALTVPFVEDFAADAANWRDAASNPVVHVASGGVGGAGDGYISTVRTFANTTQAQTVFRGHDDFDSSGDAFVGNWPDGGVERFAFWIRHDASVPLTIGTRFAGATNSPAFNIATDPVKIGPGQWTPVAFSIAPMNPGWIPEGPVTFEQVFGDIHNLQISARRESLPAGTQVTFDLDRVTLIPEPTSLALVLGAATIVAVSRRRRRGAARMAPLLLLLVATQISYAERSNDTATMTPLAEPLASFGAATLDGWLYVYGGHVGEKHEHSRDNVRGTFRRQSLDGGPWEDLPGGPALQSPALVASGNRLYRIGGLSAMNAADEASDLHSVASIDCYDPVARKWTPLPQLPQPRSSHDAVSTGGRIYVAGGWNHHGVEGEADWHEDVLMLDLTSDEPEWKIVATTRFQRRALALAAKSDRLYIIGGMTPDTDFSRRVEILDLSTGEWSSGPDLPESEMNGFGASAFEIGGQIFASSMSYELLSLSGDETSWQRVEILKIPRFFHRLVPGRNGTVLLIGGANETHGHLATIDCIAHALTEF